MEDSCESKRGVKASDFVRLRFQTFFRVTSCTRLLFWPLWGFGTQGSRAEPSLFPCLPVPGSHTPFPPVGFLEQSGTSVSTTAHLALTLTVVPWSDPQHCLPCRPLLSMHTIKCGPPQPVAPDAIQHLSLGIRAVHRQWSRYGCEAWHE